MSMVLGQTVIARGDNYSVTTKFTLCRIERFYKSRGTMLVKVIAQKDPLKVYSLGNIYEVPIADFLPITKEVYHATFPEAVFTDGEAVPRSETPSFSWLYTPTEEERLSIRTQMASLLCEYGYPYTNGALDKILDVFYRNKGWLINLLSKHPNWVPDKYQIVFSSDWTRDICVPDIDEFNSWMYRRMCDMNLAFGLMDAIWDMINAVREDRYITEDRAERVNSCLESVGITNISAHRGQKITRVLNKIAIQLGITQHNDWNRRYAKLCDACNPIQTTRHTIISVNPIDYWTMSFGNNWMSCHTIDKQNRRGVNSENAFHGCNSAGTTSYMLDSSSFIFYTIDKSYEGRDFELEGKVHRCMFHLGEEKLVQGRVYPQENDGATDLYEVIRNIVQKVVADCMDVPNLWTNVKGINACDSVVDTDEDSSNYPDYINFDNCNVSYLKREDGTRNERYITVGHVAICPYCGDEHTNQRNICCSCCE